MNRTRLDRALAALGGDRDRVRDAVSRDRDGFQIQLSGIELAAAFEGIDEAVQAVRTVRAWIEGGCR